MRRKKDFEQDYSLIGRSTYDYFRTVIIDIQRSCISNEKKDEELRGVKELYKLIPGKYKSDNLTHGVEFMCGPLGEKTESGLESIAEEISTKKAIKKRGRKKHDATEEHDDGKLVSHREAGKYLDGISGRTVGRFVAGGKLEERDGKITKDSLDIFSAELKNYYFLKDRLDYLEKSSGVGRYSIKSRIKNYLINFGGKRTSTVLVYKKADEKTFLENELTGKRKRKSENKNPYMVYVSNLGQYGLTQERVEKKLGLGKNIDNIHVGWPKKDIERLAAEEGKKTI